MNRTWISTSGGFRRLFMASTERRVLAGKFIAGTPGSSFRMTRIMESECFGVRSVIPIALVCVLFGFGTEVRAQPPLFESAQDAVGMERRPELTLVEISQEEGAVVYDVTMRLEEPGFVFWVRVPCSGLGATGAQVDWQGQAFGRVGDACGIRARRSYQFRIVEPILEEVDLFVIYQRAQWLIGAAESWGEMVVRHKALQGNCAPGFGYDGVWCQSWGVPPEGVRLPLRILVFPWTVALILSIALLVYFLSRLHRGLDWEVRRFGGFPTPKVPKSVGYREPAAAPVVAGERELSKTHLFGFWVRALLATAFQLSPLVGAWLYLEGGDLKMWMAALLGPIVALGAAVLLLPGLWGSIDSLLRRRPEFRYAGYAFLLMAPMVFPTLYVGDLFWWCWEHHVFSVGAVVGGLMLWRYLKS